MQSPNFPPTVRSSNFELLRIFCMLSIVAVHYVWHGGSAASGSNIAAAYFLGNFAQIGVACFVLIGAWFLIDKEFSITRIFNLSKQITFYSLSIALLLFIIGMASYTDIIKMQCLSSLNDIGFWPLMYFYYFYTHFSTTYWMPARKTDTFSMHKSIHSRIRYSNDIYRNRSIRI